ncbi:MAG: hypothetical protein M0R33_17130 [Methylomonas sp.]|jgi:hypothetical protein|uniref:hypothetical protein n=1 Tax=Methylomonas sp. TaxID=418 RepID=UPI0025DB731C|nr:hypothetical protein [Methylomonas sp.]MCK9608170.1 hypothetical protein [Methylomonas sp.]
MAKIPSGIVSIKYIPEYECAYGASPEGETIPADRKTPIALGTYIAYPNDQCNDINDFEKSVNSLIWQTTLDDLADEHNVELSEKKRNNVQVIAQLFDEYQRGNLSEANLNLQIEERELDITIAELSEIMKCAPAQKALDVIRQLNQPIAGVTRETRINFCIEYPLDGMATFCVKFGEDLPISLLTLYYVHSAVYREIYRLEAEYEKQRESSEIDGAQRNACTHFGIWGHDLGDLIYNGDGDIIRDPTLSGEWIEVYLDCDS